MRQTLTLAVLTLTALTGCAHAQKEQAPLAVTREPTPAATKPQLTPVATVDDHSNANAELASALGSTGVFFQFNRDLLEPEGMQALQRVAEVLRRHPSTVLKIEGNCDERGTEEYNLMLGQQRAEAARKYLAELGVRSGQLQTLSYGALRPANADHTEAAWRVNRRDDLHAER